MELKNYLQRTTQQEFAKQIGVTQGAVHQWSSGRSLPSPERCVQIEKATLGEVTRPELRPDWQRFWPELANQPTTNQGA
jgi:DNA-binding transcriptional regulator YdaS (Cro superfamily)